VKKTLALIALLGLPLSACNDPGQLQPLVEAIDSLPGLPPPGECTGDDCCLEEGWCLDVEWLTLRNVGGTTVTISSVGFSGGDAESFANAAASATEVGPDEQVALLFRYETPGGEAQSSTLVVESDATNATLEIPVATLDYVAPPPQDAGPDDAGQQTDAGGQDAGQQIDAGGQDAGQQTDAGAQDAGGDAG
jgi:hypothetical protein